MTKKSELIIEFLLFPVGLIFAGWFFFISDHGILHNKDPNEVKSVYVLQDDHNDISTKIVDKKGVSK